MQPNWERRRALRDRLLEAVGVRYSDDQPRDTDGKWTTGGGDAGSNKAQYESHTASALAGAKGNAALLTYGHTLLTGRMAFVRQVVAANADSGTAGVQKATDQRVADLDAQMAALRATSITAGQTSVFTGDAAVKMFALHSEHMIAVNIGADPSIAVHYIHSPPIITPSPRGGAALTAPGMVWLPTRPEWSQADIDDVVATMKGVPPIDTLHADMVLLPYITQGGGGVTPISVKGPEMSVVSNGVIADGNDPGQTAAHEFGHHVLDRLGANGDVEAEALVGKDRASKFGVKDITLGTDTQDWGGTEELFAEDFAEVFAKKSSNMLGDGKYADQVGNVPHLTPDAKANFQATILKLLPPSRATPARSGLKFSSPILSAAHAKLWAQAKQAAFGDEEPPTWPTTPTRAVRSNPNHAPAGTPDGGEFTSAPGGGSAPAALAGTMAGGMLHPDAYAQHAQAITDALDAAHKDDPTWNANVAAVTHAMANYPMIHTAQLGNIPTIDQEGLLPASAVHKGLAFDQISGLDRTVFMRMGQAGGGGHGAVGVMIDPTKLDPSQFIVTRLGLMTLKHDEDPWLRTPGDHRTDVLKQLQPYMDSTVAIKDLPAIQSRLLVNGYLTDHPDAKGTTIPTDKVVENDHGEMEVKYAATVPTSAIVAYFAGDKPLPDFGDKTAFEYLKDKVAPAKLVQYHGESMPELSKAYRAHYATKARRRKLRDEFLRRIGFRYNENHDKFGYWEPAPAARFDESEPRDPKGEWTSGGESTTATMEALKTKLGLDKKLGRDGTAAYPRADQRPFGPDVLTTEASIKDGKTETAVVWNAAGERAFTESQGHKREVLFTDEQMAQMKDGVLTHNHPQASSLSPADVHTAVSGDLVEVRAVTKSGDVYSMRRPANGWPTEAALARAVRQTAPNLYAVGRAKLMAFKGKPEYEAELMKMATSHNDALWSRVAPKFGIPYEHIPPKAA